MESHSIPSPNGINFGIFFFSSGEGPSYRDRYRLVIEGARFADRHGFASLWVPERHFTQVGCLYPNPSVLQAALARETQQIHLRAGSVVLPLHNPVRVAEEWALVDNLSGGRVGLSIASGWHPDDFVLYPDRYDQRHEEMYRSIAVVQKLWRGESIQLPGGDGRPVEVKTYPTPVQRELPIWVTAAGNPKTFRRAGEIGAHVLTHLFNQSMDELAEKITLYRQGRADHGHDPHSGQVAVMVHTYIGDNLDRVLAQVRAPFLHYLRTSAELLRGIAYSQGQHFDISQLSAEQLDEYLHLVFERLLLDRVLFGTPESCFPLVQKLADLGVNEIACQLDFGIDTELALESMSPLVRLKERCEQDLRTEPIPSITVSETAAETPASEIIPDRQEQANLLVLQARCQEEVGQANASKSLSLRPGGPWAIEQVWRGQGEALGKLRGTGLGNDASFRLQSALVDACAAVLASATEGDGQGPWRLQGFRQLQPASGDRDSLWAHAVLSKPGHVAEGELMGDLRLLDDQGKRIGEVKGLRLQRLRRDDPSSEWTRFRDWLYELQWQAIDWPAQEKAGFDTPGSWLIVGAQDGVGQQLASLLEDQGQTGVLLSAASEDLGQQLEVALGRAPAPVRGVIHLGNLNAPDLDQLSVASLETAQQEGLESVVHLVQKLATLSPDKRPRLWLVTRGAQPVAKANPRLAVAQAPIWGLGRMILVENPQLWGGLVDLDPDAAAQDSAHVLARVLQRCDREDQVAFRNGQQYAARLVRKQAPTSRRQPLRMQSEGSYLVTGGLGGLGLEVAGWLVDLGARNLILLGRTPLPARETWDQIDPGDRAARAVGVIQDLEARGARCRVASVDIADEAALPALLAEVRGQGLGPIRGVIHAAGVWRDQTLAQMDIPTLKEVLRPKLAGAWLLHQLLSEEPLDFFVLFSSAASLLSTVGQGNYAAANAFLDSLAHLRRVQGRPALCLNWGPWSEVGFAATAEGRQAHAILELQGIGRIDPRDGLGVMQLLMEQGETQAGVIRLDWGRLLQAHAAVAEWPLLADLVKDEMARVQARRLASATDSTRSLALLRAKKPYAPPQSELEQVLVQMWEEILHTGPIGIHDSFFELGGHSLQGGVFANRLQEKLGEVVHIVALYDAPTIADLAVYLSDRYPRGVARLLNQEAPADSEESKPTRREEARSEITQAQVNQLRAFINTWPFLPPTPEPAGPRNRPAVFVFSAPRSGSTLLRVMLAGHPRLFAPPELGLLTFRTLQERRSSFAGRNEYRLQGTIQALQTCMGWEAERATAFMEECERDNWSTRDCYRFVQDHIGDRILVDKTPNYALKPDTLQRAEAYFEDALYIHLVRHPYGMILSFEESRMDALFPTNQPPFPPRVLGELVWLITNQNILKFLEIIPAERQYRVRYEDIVSDAQAACEGMCRFLSLDFHPDMTQPYQEGQKRMTDGVRMLGDPKFHMHKGINASGAKRWMSHYREDFLSSMTWDLAESLGYPRRRPSEQSNGARDNDILQQLQGASEEEVDALLARLQGESTA
jgi:phthiocerol/phenolphthiocerol synthesis type-I polyketide synthase D